MISIKDLKIKIFADAADINQMKEAYNSGVVKGFTTNPSLMKKAGITDYEGFAKKVLKEIPDMPISFEVFSDDLASMEREANKIASWAKNVYVKIPITNTKGESTIPLIKKLSSQGISLNITAMLTVEQVRESARAVNLKSAAIFSMFAGRIADTGRDPVPYMKESASLLKSNSNAELLWASSREVLNIFQAQDCGCAIITVTPEIIKKVNAIGKDLAGLSLDTVKQFYNDATSSGFKI